jgi:serine-type D-Ala-D-Ala carboxypeptidase (penicillin-binding protein 5/6)
MRPRRHRLPTLAAMVALVALVAVLCAATPAGAAAAAKPHAGPKVNARAAILVDAGSGAVLWGRATRTARAPASLTKMLTAVTVRASLGMEDRVVAWRDATRQPATRLALRHGQQLLVWQALEALMVVSANDVAVMLADGAGGSVARFARAMDAESRRLGLRDSRWRNPNGLDAAGHRSSAFDLAILARAVLRDPWLARVVRKRRAAFVAPGGHHHTLYNRSHFLRDYKGAIGVKTGFTDDAGHCLAAAASRHGRTLIAVVLDSPDNAADAGRLLDWGFGPGRAARTGLRLPAYLAPASVASLLAPPARAATPRGPRPAPAPVRATARPSPAGWGALAAGNRAEVLALGAGVVVLGGAGLAVRRRRRRRIFSR